MARLRHRGEQRGEGRAKVGADRRVIEEAGRRAGLKSGPDVRLDWGDMALVLTVGRYRQIVGVEDGDLSSTVLDRRAPVGSRRIAVG